MSYSVVVQFNEEIVTVIDLNCGLPNVAASRLRDIIRWHKELSKKYPVLHKFECYRFELISTYDYDEFKTLAKEGRL